MFGLRRAYKRALHTWSDPKFCDLVAGGTKALTLHNEKLENLDTSTSSGESGHLYDILSELPSASFVFGYGSGVVKQLGYSESDKPQIDMLLSVSNPAQWHQENMTKNPNHYSSLANLGSLGVKYIQNLGAGVYFNPYVDIGGHLVKYGVVDINVTIRDLVQWETLYLAGRLQKPVKILVNNSQVEFANQYNLQLIVTLSIALIASKKAGSLSLTDFQFTDVELYETIAGVSYLGDIRILLGGENPDKVKNIVKKQKPRFDQLYAPIISRLVGEEIILEVKGNGESQTRTFKLGSANIEDGIHTLPLTFRNNLAKSENLSKAIQETVRYPSVIQTMKGIFTAGIVKSAKYALEKKAKSKK